MSTAQALLTTDRLVLRPWEPADARDALAIFGRDEVTRWLSPAMSPVEDEMQMLAVLREWQKTDAGLEPPVGHWAVLSRDDDALVGSITLRRLPPGLEDLELAWQFAPEHWGHGYATEAARAIAAWAFEQSAHELFAVMRPANQRATAMARRLGMQWVGETDKYYGLQLQVYRLWPAELDRSAG